MIKVRLHRNELIRAGACSEGMKLFDSLQRRGVFRSAWTPLHMVWFSVAYPSFSSWMIDKGLLPRLNLYGANGVSLPAGWEVVNGIACRKKVA